MSRYRLSRRSFLAATGAATAMSTLSPLSVAVPEQIEHASIPDGANVSLIANALRDMGFDAMKLAMSTDIKALVLPKGKTAIGPAVTTKWEAARDRMTKEAVRKFVFDPLDAAPAGAMWVVASGTDRIYSMFGDIIALACKRNGLAGAVTDSGCRDIAGIEALQFPVFAKSAVPYGPGDHIHPVAANVPVICGGVLVQPGDLIAADVDGVIVIPQLATLELADAVAKRAAKEDDMRRQIEAGATLARISHTASDFA